MPRKIREYASDSVTVTYDKRRCLHAEECVKRLPEVFDRDRRPWIDPSQGDLSSIADAVRHCPTGALQIRTGGTVRPADPGPNVVTISEDGPLYVRGEITLETVDGPVTDTRVALCRCGQSRDKPFCDNRHRALPFKDAGRLGTNGKAQAEDGPCSGALRIEPGKDGPYHVSGAVRVAGHAGGTVTFEEDIWLCRCGHSENKPYCDGSHRKAEFRAD